MKWTVYVASVLLVGSGATAVGTIAVTAQEAPSAPDGRPGLGTERTAHELGRLFASPDDEQEQLLRELHDLPSDILILREMVRRRYRALGYFEILDPIAEQELSALHGKYRELDETAMGTLVASGRVTEAFMKLFLDQRFQIRLRLLEAFSTEKHELRRGLRVLYASQDGLFDLRDGEARNIAARIDLSAAILRAIRLDLDALRERGDDRTPGSPDPAWMAELIGLTKLRLGEDRSKALARLRAKIDRRIERLESALFLPRLEKKVTRELAKRAALADQALQHLERAQNFLLVPPYDRDPPRQIAAMSTSERHRYALSEATRGIAADPLNEELTYWMAIATELLYSTRESSMWFDRYLSLRGIRPQDIRTTRDRDLTHEEKYALERALLVYTGLVGSPGR